MKILGDEELQDIAGGGTVNGCAAAAVAGFGIIAISGMTGGLGLFLAAIFFEGAVRGLIMCTS